MHGPPKPQRLYPDLSNLMQTETSETEFTCESSEPETATLEEKTETETDGEFYLQVGNFFWLTVVVLFYNL